MGSSYQLEWKEFGKRKRKRAVVKQAQCEIGPVSINVLSEIEVLIVLVIILLRTSMDDGDDVIGKLSLELSLGVLSSHGSRFLEIRCFDPSEVGFHDRLPKLVPLVDAYALALMAWNVIVCLIGMDMIACLHGMNVIAYIHGMDVISCLHGMNEKVSEIGSKARKDDIKNEKD
ncbi:hypothetical protein Tco_0454595 [Tanacetum coccineum]